MSSKNPNAPKLLIKFSGKSFSNGVPLPSLMEDVVMAQRAGFDVALVHGGGPQITAAFKKLNIESKFIDGLRITPEAVVAEVKNAFERDVRPGLITALRAKGAKPVGLSGDENGLLAAKRHENTDLGMVGNVEDVKVSILHDAFDRDLIPVISPTALAGDDLVNVNADTAAAKIAERLGAHTFILMSDIDGIYEFWPDETSVLQRVGIRDLKSKPGMAEGGMIPKIEACDTALKGGAVQMVCVANGGTNNIIGHLLLGKEIGTRVLLDEQLQKYDPSRSLPDGVVWPDDYFALVR